MQYFLLITFDWTQTKLKFYCIIQSKTSSLANNGFSNKLALATSTTVNNLGVSFDQGLSFNTQKKQILRTPFVKHYKYYHVDFSTNPPNVLFILPVLFSSIFSSFLCPSHHFTVFLSLSPFSLYLDPLPSLPPFTFFLSFSPILFLSISLCFSQYLPVFSLPLSSFHPSTHLLCSIISPFLLSPLGGCRWLPGSDWGFQPVNGKCFLITVANTYGLLNVELLPSFESVKCLGITLL